MGDRKSAASSTAVVKAILRRDMRRRRLELTDRSERSVAIWRHVVGVPEVVDATRILVFRSIPGEPETAPFVEWAVAAGKLTAVPEDGVASGWPDVVLVPGLAFTADGRRLGQGGGWYDRFLAGVAEAAGGCLTIGVGFAEQLLDTLPTEAHDVVLDRVITDDGPASRHREASR